MDTYLAGSGAPRRYELKVWIRVMHLAFAGFAGSIGIFLFQQSRNNSISNIATIWLTAAGLILLAIYLGLSSFLSFVQFDHESISVGGVFNTRTMRLDAVKGFRKRRTRNGSYLILESKNPEDPELRVWDRFNLDDQWAAWVQSLTDLDQADRQSALDAIASAEELGDSQEARLGKLATAKLIAIVLSVLAIVSGVSLLIYSKSLSSNLFGGIDLLLILLPWIALLLQATSPLLYSTFANNKDPRATLSFVLLASAFGVFISPFSNLQIVPMLTLIAYGCIPGLILGGAFLMNSPRTAQPSAPWFLLLLITCVYGTGVVRQIDTQLDTSQPRQYSTQVLDKSMSRGRSTTYYLRLNSWEPRDNYKKVSVSNSLYHSVQIGDSVCITAHDGALQVPWFTVQLCH